MTAPTVQVTVDLFSITGAPCSGVVVSAKLDKNDAYAGGIVISERVSAVTDVNGVAVLSLFPNHPVNGLGTQGSRYTFSALVAGGKPFSATAQIPNSNCSLQSVMDMDTVAGLSAAQLAEAAAQLAAAQAASSAADAAAAESTVAADAAAAVTSAGNAAASATAAANSATAANTSAGNAAASATAAVTSQTAAAASAAAAATSEGNAAGSATAAAGSATAAAGSATAADASKTAAANSATAAAGSATAAATSETNAGTSATAAANSASSAADSATTVTNAINGLAGTSSSALIGYTQGGTGASLTNVQAKLRETVSVADFGVAGDGVTDDTAKVQAAIDAVSAAGGGTVTIPAGAKLLIDSATLYVRSKVALVGPRGSKTRVNNPVNSSMSAGLIVSPAYTVNLAGDGAALESVYVLRKNLYRPATVAEATTELANFAGTGITVQNSAGGTATADDCKVRNVFVAGFAQAIYGTYCGRYLFENVIGDNLAGIKTENIFDVGRTLNCHFWPFITSGLGGTGSQNWRAGVGFEIAAANDWSQVQDCFCFGYTTGFKIGANSVRLIGCGADGNSAAQPAGSKAFHILSTAVDCQLIGCEAAAHEYPYYSESTNVVRLNGCAAWGSPVNHVYQAAGTLLVQGGYFYNTASNAAIYAAAGITKLSVSGTTFNGVGTAYSLASVLKCDIAPDNIYLGTVNGLAADTHKHVEATAAVGNSWYSVGGAGGFQHRNYLAAGTPAAPTTVASGNTLGSYRFFGYDGAAFVQSAIMRGSVDAAPSAGIVPGSIIWSTQNTAGVFADRLVLKSNGDLAPVTDNANSSGQSGLRWSAVYATSVKPTGGTAATSAPVIDATQTWNDGAGGTVVFTGWKLNITDTLSAAGSLLADLQVGGSSKFAVRKDGSILLPGSVTYTFGAGSNSPDTVIFAVSGGSQLMGVSKFGYTVQPAAGLWGWTQNTAVSISPDTALGRNAAGVVEVNNGTAGTFRDLKLRTLAAISGTVGPVSTQSANYTTTLADANGAVIHPSTDAAARTFTIDSNANVAYAVGTTLTFPNDSANACTIAIAGTDTLTWAGPGTTGPRTLAANGIATAIKTAATRWLISGNLS